jgi:glyoxylase-like metal-dependent hydrolase (beta-lactamase superfamily II)
MLTQLHLPIVNVTVIRQRHTVLVDTGAPGDARRILGGLQRLGISAGEVSLIVLTHGHSDHTGNAAELRDALRAPIAMHAGDLALVRQGRNGDFVNMGLEAAVSRRFVDRPFPAFEPDILLEEGSDLTAFGLEATLLHTPGHSQGSLSLLLDGGTAIAGDILRGGLLGGKVFAGRPSYPYFMPSLDALPELRAGVRRVLDTGAQRLLVGHGGPIAGSTAEAWLARVEAKAAGSRGGDRRPFPI